MSKLPTSAAELGQQVRAQQDQCTAIALEVDQAAAAIQTAMSAADMTAARERGDDTIVRLNRARARLTALEIEYAKQDAWEQPSARGELQAKIAAAERFAGPARFDALALKGVPVRAADLLGPMFDSLDRFWPAVVDGLRSTRELERKCIQTSALIEAAAQIAELGAALEACTAGSETINRFRAAVEVYCLAHRRNALGCGDGLAPASKELEEAGEACKMAMKNANRLIWNCQAALRAH